MLLCEGQLLICLAKYCNYLRFIRFSNSLITLRKGIIMKSIKFLFAILFSIAVAACGGGSDYGSSSGNPAVGYSISGTISGGVTNNSGVMVNLTGAATKNMTTAAGGSYTFTGLANGSYTVTPNLAGYGFTPSSITVTVYNNNPSNINFTETP